MLFALGEIARLLGTSELRLNKLLYRFKLQPARGGGRKGKARRFSIAEVSKLGLTLWLFRAGLRAVVIHKILKHRRTKSLVARLRNLGAIRAECRRSRFFLVWNLDKKKPSVAVGKEIALAREISVVVPVGQLLEELLAKRIREFESKRR